MIIADTYIVVNSMLLSKLRHIEHFTLDLGSALTTTQKFNPKDVNIQKHYMMHHDIINMCGSIGTLFIYTKPTMDINKLYLYNEEESFDYTINDNLSLYDNINLALSLFFEKLGIESNVNTKKQEEIKIPEYVKPDKPLNQMTMEERIAFLRNRK